MQFTDCEPKGIVEQLKVLTTCPVKTSRVPLDSVLLQMSFFGKDTFSPHLPASESSFTGNDAYSLKIIK